MSAGGEHHEQTDGVGAPQASTINCRSMPLFLDLDILVMPAWITGCRPFSGRTALVMRPLSSRSTLTSRAEPDVAALLIACSRRRRPAPCPGKQAFERLVAVHQARITQQLVEEAGAEQVHTGVLDAADVLIHRQPVVGAAGSNMPLLVVGEQ